MPCFNGDPKSITIGGQSSRGMMIQGGYHLFIHIGIISSYRMVSPIALMASPVTARLFNNAILQSDPMFYNFLPNDAYNTIQFWYYSNLPCSPSSCSVSQLLSTQGGLLGNTLNISPVAGSAEPIHPSLDGLHPSVTTHTGPPLNPF